MPETEIKPYVGGFDCSGPSGNAFVILGHCQKAARKAGWSREKTDKVMEDMTNGDYKHLKEVAKEHFTIVFLNDDDED